MFNAFMALVGFALIILVASVVRDWANAGLDDSDKDGRNRSGVNVVTDHRTGRQYLVAPGGGITPRLDADGRHMSSDPEAGR